MKVREVRDLIGYLNDEAEVYFCNEDENPLEGRKIKGVLKVEKLRNGENEVAIVLVGGDAR